MIATIEYVNVLDRSEALGKMILSSDLFENYIFAQKEMNTNKETQKLIKDFVNIKAQYEDVERFGRYHPDYNKIMKNVRSIKRNMDMDDKVASFKVAERNLQALLDEISGYIAHSASKQIKAPVDGAALTDSGCSTGGCGSGGSCAC